MSRGGVEASHGDVAGVWLTHKVGASWDEDTDRVMTHQFGGGFKELLEVLEVSSCGIAYPGWAARVLCCVKDKLHWGKGYIAPDVRVNEPRQEELKVDGEMVPKEEDLSQVTNIS